MPSISIMQSETVQMIDPLALLIASLSAITITYKLVMHYEKQTQQPKAKRQKLSANTKDRSQADLTGGAVARVRSVRDWCPMREDQQQVHTEYKPDESPD